MKILLHNIAQLLQIRTADTIKLSGREMNELPLMEHAWLLIDDQLISDFGTGVPPQISADQRIDCSGKIVLPSWCDSHTHTVYAGNREQEFVDRINGLTYQEIAEKGGGILNSAKKLQQTSETDLYEQSAERIEEMMKQGTGAVEIKSGYGLTTEAEMKMLRVAKKLDENYPITVKTTFLGAHAVPKEFSDNKSAYVDLICEEMLPQIAEEQLADFIDVFCEKGYFDLEDTERILKAGQEYNLPAKIHVNQFNSIGGIELAVKYNALTVDHLEVLSDSDLLALRNGNTMPVALPACSFFLGIPYTPARTLIDSGLPLAVATDFNPGSAPSGNMNFVVSTSCIKMNMTPEEAINAATVNAAYAMGLENTHGSITKGKIANLIITKQIPSYGFIPYSFGENVIDKVICRGTLI